jgi:hypothetical protein
MSASARSLVLGKPCLYAKLEVIVSTAVLLPSILLS